MLNGSQKCVDFGFSEVFWKWIFYLILHQCVLIEYDKTFGYLGRVPGIYFGLRAGSSFPFFEVFGLRAGSSIAKFASDGRAGRPRLGLNTSLDSENLYKN